MPNDITLNEFEAIAATCTRWEPRSLAVVKALLIDTQPITQVANAHDMTVQQANVLRTRFMSKLSEYQLSAFTNTEAPAGQPSKYPKLEKRETQIRALADEGYTDTQIVKFLSGQGIKAKATEIRKFLQGSKP